MRPGSTAYLRFAAALGLGKKRRARTSRLFPAMASSRWRIVPASARFALAILIIVGAAAQPSHAGVGIDSTSSANSASTTQLTIPHTIGVGSDRALIVTVMTRGTPSPSQATSVTYGGAALFSVQSALSLNPGANNYRVQFFALADPPAGTADVVITFNVGAPVVAGVISFFGVDQSIVAEPAGAVSQDNVLEIYVARSNDLIVDAFVATSAMAPIAPQAAQTQYYNATADTVLGGGSTKPGTDAEFTAISWSRTVVSGALYNLSAIAVKAPAGLSTPTASTTPTVTVTATRTPTRTMTATRTSTATRTATRTQTPTVTATATFTETLTPPPTATATDSFTPTGTTTPTPADTATFTPTPSATQTQTATQTETSTPTCTHTSTGTPTSTATSTWIPPATHTATSAATPTATPTATETAPVTPPQPDGATCAGPEQCLSTFCVGGICCDSACRGAHQACNVPGHVGTCEIVHAAPALPPLGLAAAFASLGAIGVLAMRRSRR